MTHDLRYAARSLRKSPGFAAVAVLTLAVGIGANAVVFSVARTVLLRPLGFEGEDRLVWVRLANTRTGADEPLISWREMEDVAALTRIFESVATFGSTGATWGDGGPGDEVPVLQVSAGLPEALRVRPAIGRMFLPSEYVTGDDAVLISHDLWQSHYNGRPDVIGRTVRVDSKPRTIVGVLPQGLQFPLERHPASGAGAALKAGRQAFWLPMPTPRGDDLTSRAARMFTVVGRLRPGVDPESARSELTLLGQRLAAESPKTNRNLGFDLVSFRDHLFGRTARGVPLLAAAVGAVLLVCCVNLANLLLARGVTRHRELAVRAALGAGRGRLVAVLLAESVLLSLGGGAAGVALAGAALRVVQAIAATTVPFIREATVDASALAFTAGVSLLAALVFGLLPALRQSRTDAADALRAGARSTGGPRVRAWQRNLLVGQVAAVLVLLASAGLLLESFRRLIGQDLGYQPHSVVALDLNQSGFATNGDVCRLYRALRQRLAALPGVEAVGTVSSAPLTGKWPFTERANVVGNPTAEADRPALAATFVAFDYFQAMGIPLRDGRFFGEEELDDDGYGQVVMLNESAARALFPAGPRSAGASPSARTRTACSKWSASSRTPATFSSRRTRSRASTGSTRSAAHRSSCAQAFPRRSSCRRSATWSNGRTRGSGSRACARCRRSSRPPCRSGGSS